MASSKERTRHFTSMALRVKLKKKPIPLESPVETRDVEIHQKFACFFFLSFFLFIFYVFFCFLMSKMYFQICGISSRSALTAKKNPLVHKGLNRGYLLSGGEYQIYYIECVEARVKILMFLTQEMRYIWYLP